ncbi:OmpA family protein [Pseudomonas sp.]|uniref:OmpA family protein n=1 Tax=Pseudomonas sp. TaxID=306 RepID=UPI003A96D0C5
MTAPLLMKGVSMSMLTEETLRLGGDPSQGAEFITLGGELAKLNHPACPDVDWARVQQLAIGLFRENGVELQSAAAFALAHSHLHGLAGMGDALCLLNRLLAQGWERLWPPALPARLEILAWLFTQLQPLFRQQELTRARLPELSRLDDELRQLSERLQMQVQVPLVPLQALCKQLQGALQRLTSDVTEGAPPLAAPADEAVAVTRRPVGASSAPAFIVLKLDATEPAAGPVAQPALRSLWLWLLVLMILLAGLFGWWVKGSTSAQIEWLSPAVFSATAPAQQAKNLTHLDNQVLFPPGRAELKPESTKVLVNSLIDIKAQPGWLIVISGHSDASGDPERNRVLSRQRAEAVKQWMQRVGDIPDSCFVTQGKGAEQPIADNQTESGRRSNRRVDIQLVPSLGACTSPVH